VSGEFLAPTGPNKQAEFLPGDLGYKMRQDQRLRLGGFQLSVGKKMTMSFWLYSVNPGRAEDTVTGELRTPHLSVLDLAKGVLDPYTGSWVAGDPIFIVREQAEETGKNKLWIKVINHDFDPYTVLTETYDSDKWHHFWIVFNGGGTFQVYIDGKNAQLDTVGDFPSQLDAAHVEFSINRFIQDNDHPVTLHYGYIDDIAVLSTAITNESSIQKAVNWSIDYVVDSDFNSIEEVDFGLLYDDPTAVRINGLADDGTHIYATRTDGKVLQGAPLLWESRRSYSNPDEVDALDVFGDGLKVEDGYLKITGGTVRL